MTDSATATRPRARGRRGVRIAAHVGSWLAVLAIALWVVLGKRDELAGVGTYLQRLHWQWLAWAAGFEIASYAAFGALQGRLLLAGGVALPLSTLTALALAGNAMQNSLPAGPAWANVFAYRQYRRRGADEVLAAWTLVAVSICSGGALALLGAVGVAVAGNEGALFDITVIVGSTAAAGLAVASIVRRPHLIRPVPRRVVRMSQRVARRPAGDAHEIVERLIVRLRAVPPSTTDWTMAFGLAMANWVFDCACLALAFLAIGAGVPWRGLLLAYGAGQLAASLPITPGGLGVVEGSLTIALVAYGGSQASTVAGVLIYRIISFWAVLPVGWAVWGVFAYQRRRDPTPLERVGA